MIERKPISRDEFINKVANWLPEYKNLYLRLLSMETKDQVRFVRDDGQPVVLWKNGKEFLRFAEG